MNAPSKGLAEAIREHIGGLQRQRASLVEQRERANAEVESLWNAPISREEALAFCCDYIDVLGAAYPATAGNFAALFDRVAWPRRYDVPPGGVPGNSKGAPLNLRDVDRGLSADYCTRDESFSGGLSFFGVHAGFMRTDAAAYFFFGDIIKQRIAEQFDAFYPRPANSDAGESWPPIADRRARIAELEAEIESLNAALAGIEAELKEIRDGTVPAVATVTEVAAPPRELTTVDQEKRDVQIYAAYNGKNAQALADKYGVTFAHVMKICVQSSAPGN